MKKNCYLSIVIYIFVFLIIESCANHVYQQKQKNGCIDTLIVDEDSFIPDKAYIESLIRGDQKKRNMMSWIDTSSSPLFYKTMHDEGIILLYRVILHGHQTCVAMIEDTNIAVYGDDICYTDTNGVIYEHKGHYEIINDSMVNIFFDKLYSNYCYVNESEMFEPVYHIKGMHSYRLSGAEWHRIEADTIIVVDEREKAFCEDIWKYTD